jgi:hypothetical protein
MRNSQIALVAFSVLLLGLSPVFATERVVLGEMFTSTD